MRLEIDLKYAATYDCDLKLSSPQSAGAHARRIIQWEEIMATLREFLSGLATSPQKMEEYFRDPDAAMAAAGLSKRDKDVLKSASAATFTAAVATQPQTTVPSFSFVHGNSLISIYVVVSPIATAAEPRAEAAVAVAIRPPPTIIRPATVRPPPAIIRPATVNVVRPPVVHVPTVRPSPNGHKKKGKKGK